ncbi:MAG: type II secretion system protein N [Novosphingobium sp.]
MGFGHRRLIITGLRPGAPSLHDVLWWVLAALIAGLGAALLWAIVTPVAPLGEWTPRGVRMLSPTARAALFASVDPFNRTNPAAAQTEQSGAITSLALTLFATRATPGGGGTAIIAGGDGVQQVYRVGAEVQPGVTLAAVAFDHVELSRNGAKELLYLDQSGAAPTADGVVAANPVAAPAPAAPGSGVSVAALRSGVNFGPRAEGGKVVGVEVLSSGDGSAFRAAGFQPGDVITAVDGKPIASAADAAALSGAIRAGTSVAVTVRRGDRQLPLAITLAP